MFPATCRICAADPAAPRVVANAEPCPSCGSALFVHEDGDEIETFRFVSTKLNSEDVIEQVTRQIFGRAGGSRKVLIDFNTVEFTSSAVLRKLITLQRSISATGRRLRLCCSERRLYDVFASTKLDQLLDIHRDRQSAVTDF